MFKIINGIAQWWFSFIHAGDALNYTEIKSDGEINLHGTARVTKKSWIDAGGMRSPGLKPATFVLKGIVGAWEFSDAAAGNEESISGVWTIPKEMELGSVITFKLNWFANGVSPGNCEWQLEYLWIKENEDETAAAQGTVTTTSTASATSNGMVNATFSGIDAPDSDDKGLFFRITRLSVSGNDTIAAAVWLRGRSILYTADSLG